MAGTECDKKNTSWFAERIKEEIQKGAISSLESHSGTTKTGTTSVSLSEFSDVDWDEPNLFTFKTLMNVGNGDYEFFKPVSNYINECFEKRKCVPVH